MTTLGSGIGGAIRRLSTTFEARGLPLTLSSYDNASVTSGTIVNQVRFAYNAFSQLLSDSQSHGGPVVASTTAQVSLTYADGSGNTIRPTGLMYPDGRVVSYDYGTTDGIKHLHNRPDVDQVGRLRPARVVRVRESHPVLMWFGSS